MASLVLLAANQIACAEQAADKVTFRTQDVDSQSGCTIEYHVQAGGPKALVVIQYVAKAEHIGKRAGHVEHVLADFKQSTLTWLDHRAGTYEVRQVEGLRNVPFAKLIEVLRKQDVETFKKTVGVHGTMYEGKTVTTHVVAAEKDVKFKPEILSVPPNYKEKKPEGNNLNAGQPGAQNPGAPSFTAPGGSPMPGGTSSVPGGF